jgi:hypothetical protein
MPYYIYKITPGATPLVKELERLTEFGAFKDATRQAKAMRAEAGPDADYQIKVIFAESELEAEEKLLEHREAPILKEWEK